MRRSFLTLAGLLLAASFSAQAEFVLPPVDLGATAIGKQIKQSITVQQRSVDASSQFTLLYGTEFKLSKPSCSSGTCRLDVTITPRDVGTRQDVIVIRDGGGNVLGRGVVRGSANGPRGALRPGTAKYVFPPDAELYDINIQAFDGAGNGYAFSRLENQILKISADDQSVKIVAGQRGDGAFFSDGGYSGDGGPATEAQFKRPTSLALDSYGNIFVADTDNNAIRKVDTVTGIITTVAGNGIAGQTGIDGPAKDAELTAPTSLAIDRSGNLLFLEQVDPVNNQPYVYKIDESTQKLSIAAGTGVVGNDGDGGSALNANIRPAGLAVDAAGNLYIAQAPADFTHGDPAGTRKISNGTITRFAGAESGDEADGHPALETFFTEVLSPTFDQAGNLYFLTKVTNTSLVIRKLDASAPHRVSTIYSEKPFYWTYRTSLAVDRSINFYVPRSGYLVIDNRGQPLSFPETHIGFSSPPQTVIYSNTGNEDLEIKSIAIADTTPKYFDQTNTCGTLLHPDESCTITVVASPTVAEDHSASLVVVDNSTESPFNVALRVIGLPAQQSVLSTQVINFGTETAGSPSAPQTVTLSNPGIKPLRLKSITLDDPAFSLENNCGAVLAAGAQCSFNIRFTPRYGGEFLTFLQVNDDASPNAQLISLHGIATGPAATFQIGLSASHLEFGTTEITGSQWGTPVLQKRASLTLTNTGTGDLSVWYNLASNSPNAAFSYDDACGSYLRSGATCIIALTFHPFQSGFLTDTLQLRIVPPDGHYVDPVSVALTGAGLLQSNAKEGGAGYQRVSADFDGDGKADYLIWRPSDGTWYIRPSSNPAQPITQQWGLIGDVPVPGDYDGDGRADFAVWRPSVGYWCILPSSDPAHPVYRQWGLSGDVPLVADFDGDHRADLAVWRPSDGGWYVLASNSNGPIVRQWGLTGDVPLPGDYDGDGKADFAVWRPVNATWYLTLSSDLSSSQTQQWGLSTDHPIAADFDGDGRTDFAVWRPQTGEWYILPSSNPVASVVQQCGLTGDVALPADFDGDGRADFAVWRPANAAWYVRLSSDPENPITQQWGFPRDLIVAGNRSDSYVNRLATWSPANGVWTRPASLSTDATRQQQWGLPGDLPLMGDFDGDSEDDLVVWRPSTGTWYVLPSKDSSTPIIQQWGLPGDIPLIADFDGDGLADFSVWRPLDGVWYILPSSHPAQPIQQQWGLPGDIPLSADFYLDGIFDFAVWRPSNATWYVQSSKPSDPPLTAQWGRPGDVPLPLRSAFRGFEFVTWRPLYGLFYIGGGDQPVYQAQTLPDDQPFVLKRPRGASYSQNDDQLLYWRPSSGAIINTGEYSPGSDAVPNRQLGTPSDVPL